VKISRLALSFSLSSLSDAILSQLQRHSSKLERQCEIVAVSPCLKARAVKRDRDRWHGRLAGFNPGCQRIEAARLLLAGLGAGIAVGASTSGAEAAATSKRPDMRIIRNPEHHNEFGVEIEFAPVESKRVTKKVS